jgi:hypothetical protein
MSTKNSCTRARRCGQHFLKSAALRDFTLAHVAEMTEDEAHELLINHRWGGRDRIACPSCGGVGAHYYVRKGRRWRCKFSECGDYFTVFSNTVFQDRKLSHKKILMAIVVFVTFSNGISYDHFSGLLDIQIKTAQVLLGKLREVLLRTRSIGKLAVFAQIDGGHFGGRPRHGRVRRVENNAIQEHVQTMLTKKTKQPVQTVKANMKRRIKKRRVVMVMREVSLAPGDGAIRTIVEITDSENEIAAMSLASRYIKPGTLIMSDENPAYNQFSKHFQHLTVEHAKEFATIDGTNSNQAESYFSRLRRYVLGVSHRIEPKYLMDIATEMAWREDVRRMTYEERFTDILHRLFRCGKSKYWTGYWQGYNRPGEIVWCSQTLNSVVRKLD